jgi:type IV secretory pathway VirB10-like protein
MTDQLPTASNESTPPGRVIDRRQRPPGVVPRHLQQWMLVGTAVVMVGILALSGPPAKPRPTATPSPAAVAVDPNQQRIEEYQRRIQEQAQRLAAEQAQLQLTKDAVATNPTGAVGPAPRRSPVDSPAPMASASPTPDARDERARFADNVAFSRSNATPLADPRPPSDAPAIAPTTVPQVALPLPPGIPGLPGVTVAPTPPVPMPTAPVARATAPRSEPADFQYTLLEGTIIETVLTNRLDGTFSGPVNCLVSVPVYAAGHLVIPAGARVLGDARAVNTFGQTRLAVTFHRVLLPNGVHVDLDGFHGLNQIGELGLRDQVDRHYAQIFGVSLALGAIAGFAQGQSHVGLDATAGDAYRQGAAASVSQSSARVLDRFLNLLPTVTIREGHRIKVYLSSDLDLPAYRDPLRLTGGRP